MRIVSIIGTRPQYIKVKPIYDYCIANNLYHTIIDTNQHYSNDVSKKIIESLNINIDINLNAKGKNEIEFISDTINKLQNILTSIKNVFVLIYGDTNSAFAAALVCYKNNIKFAHIEAGARCFNNKVPEEVNRVFIDTAASINFCTAKRDCDNISNGVLCGDLEYELLKSFNNKNLKNYSEYGLMTVHRQSNMNKTSIEKIFNFCIDLGKIILPLHHRLKSQKWFNTLNIPNNIKITDPLNYHDMYQVMKSCRFILTDSGGVLKTSPFFGKKTLILRPQVGWIDTIEKGYAKICDFSLENKKWILNNSKDIDIDFYSQKEKTSEIIIKTIINKNDK